MLATRSSEGSGKSLLKVEFFAYGGCGLLFALCAASAVQCLLCLLRWHPRCASRRGRCPCAGDL